MLADACRWPWRKEILRRLLKSSDVLVENFKTGTLGKYGLGYSHTRSTVSNSDPDVPRLC